MTAVTLNPAGGLSQAATGVVNNSAGTKEKSTDFGNLMLGKIGNKADTQANQTEVVFKDGTKTKISTPVKKNDFSKMDVSEKTTEQIKGKIKDDKGNINAEEAAAALGVMNNIVEGVAKILGVSEEELAGSLEALGMKPEDLLNQNSLTELVLYQNGSTDVSDMLVDNGMLETFNELRDFVNSLLADEGLDANSFADMLASKEFKDAAADLLKNQEDANKVLSDFYQGEGNTSINTESVNVELNGSDNEGAGLGSGSAGKKTDDGVEVRQVEINPESFINNLENAAEIDEMTQIEQAQFREIAFQVVEQVRVNISPDTTSMEMQLNPENLGRVAINISSKAGVMTAEITTENQQAKEAIESQLQILKESIEERGVRVEAIEVKVSDFSFADSKNAESDGDQYNQGQNQRNPRRGSFSVNDEEEGINEAAIAAREILQNAGSTVNYRA